MAHEALLRRVRRLLREVARRLPALAGDAHRVEVLLDPELDTAAIDIPKRRIALSPAWCELLVDHDLMFVLAHELMHVRQRSDRRAPRSIDAAWNLACDGVINRTLEALLGPAQVIRGVTFDHAIDAETAYLRLISGWSAETRLLDYVRTGERDLATSPALARARERDRERARGPEREVGVRVDFTEVELDAADAMGDRAMIAEVAPVRPWPLAWEAAGGARRARSYLRPSRRGGGGGGVILAGRHRQRGAITTFVIPVVPQFARAAPRTLGQIRAYAEDHDVERLRLIGCDEDGVILDARLDVAAWDAQRLPGLITMQRIAGGRIDGDLCRCPGCGRPHAAYRASRGAAALHAAEIGAEEAIVIKPS